MHAGQKFGGSLVTMRFQKNYLMLSTLLGVISLTHAQDAKKQVAPKAASTSSATTSSVPAKTAAPAAKTAPVATPAAPTKAVETAAPAAPEKAVDFTAKDVWDKELFERDDNKVLVIQDRKYNKEGRLELGVDLGMTSATAFYNTYSFGVRSAYYFNEYWGLQWFGNYSINTDSKEKDQLDQYLSASGFSSTKEYKQPKLFTGIGVLWNPIYGKFAWFRSKIIHFDIYAGLGLSYLTTESSLSFTHLGQTYSGIDDSAIGSLANLGIRIFVAKGWSWTTEVRNNIYQAKYAKTRTGGLGAEIAAKDVWQNNFQFMTGVSYMFNVAGY